MKKGIKGGVAVVLSSLIIALLLLAGPAEAVILGLTVEDNSVYKGDLMFFEATAEIESGEQLNPDYFKLILNGSQLVECTFDVDGNSISGCEGISMENLQTPPYGYGYGYSSGVFKFKITLDTTYFQTGKYETYLRMIAGQKNYEKRGKDVYITNITIDSLAGCSIRAEGGSLIMGEGEVTEDFGKGKLNFHLPLGNANNGKGSLTAQRGRDRISYRFDIIDILDNNEFFARILVEGDCKINRESEQKTSEIYYDKIKNTISISCEGINLEDMKITFKRRC